MDIDEGRFHTRLATTEDEVLAAQRLRYRVFVEEMGASVSPEDTALGLERDAFDAVADHLLLIDTENDGDVVGAYRLIRGEVAAATGGFYGAAEYDLLPLVKSGRRLVELGRSCVAKSHRGGVATHCLWNGLAAYVLEREIEILFGVASFHGTDTAPLAPALSLLYHDYLAPSDLRVRARDGAYHDMNLMPPEAIDRRTAMQQVPALIKAYLRLGGSVGDGAFVDKNFNTVDVCLIMDTARMSERYRAQYEALHLAVATD